MDGRSFLSPEHPLDGASIVVERMIGFAVALLLALGGLLTLRATAMLDDRYDILLALGLVGLVAGVALLSISFQRRSAEWLMRTLPQRVRRSRGLLTAFTALTIVEQFFPVMFTWILALAFGLHVSPLVMLGAVPLSILIARLPISISGLGAFEGAFAALLSLSGVPPQYAVAIAFAGRAIETIGCFPWWLLHQLRRSAPAVEPELVTAHSAPTDRQGGRGSVT